MKKFFTIIAMMVIAIAANADITLVSYEGTNTLPDGVEISGTTVVTTAKLNMNKDTKNCIQLKNGYNGEGVFNGNAIILSVEGGFKKGDVLSVAGFFNNADETKVSKAEVFTIGEGNATTPVWTSEQFINGRTSTDIPAAQTYTLMQDMEKIYIGRNGGTGTNLIAISVTRADAPADNTIAAGKYTIKAKVTKVAPVIPAAFEKYIGNYETTATLDGDASSLVITENAEEGIFTDFEIKGDAVAFSADKMVTLGGKQFTVRAAGNDAETGSLALCVVDGGEAGEYCMAAADMYYNGVKAVTVSGIQLIPFAEAPVADFEDITIDPATGLYQPEDEESETAYWNSGDFTFSTYCDDWGEKYYYDFVGTNSTSTKYESIADQYNSAAGGAKSGDNYVVWYSNFYGSEGIYCPDAMKVSGFYVTNTAWVVDAILNGDGMSEEIDGTTGKPFGYSTDDKLTLVITGYDEDMEQTGAVDYTLAEVKDNKIYYVKDWRWVDLTTLGDKVVNVQFEVVSTKQSSYGATTPTYFCMDDFNGVAPEVDADMAVADVPTPTDAIVVAADKAIKAQPVKYFKNGRIVIEKNGKKFNAAGAQL